jgi:predicted DNA-binding transcriptional regulator YafY
MPANKYALIRYRVIDECLSNKGRPYPNKEQLREACEDRLYGSQNARVSISTIEKDLNAMRYDMALGYEAPIAFDKYHKGYYYTEEDYTIKKVPLREEDVEALLFAAQTLYQFKDVPVFTAFEHVLAKLKEHVSLSGNTMNEEYREHMLFEDSHKGTGERHLINLLKAIREKNHVKVRYTFFQEGKPTKWYTLEPFLLKQFKLRWYLIARDVDANKVKTFGLDRMEEIIHQETHFIGPDFNAPGYYENTFGINHTGGVPQRILLKVDPLESKYFLSRPIHGSLKWLRSEPDGEVLELLLVVNHDLVNELLSWSPHLTVLSPFSLRDEVIRRATELIQRYEKS